MGCPVRISLSECDKTVVLNAHQIHGLSLVHEPIEIMLNLSSKSHERVIWGCLRLMIRKNTYISSRLDQVELLPI